LQRAGLKVEKEKAMPLVYKEVQLDQGFRMDIVVENKVVIENEINWKRNYQKNTTRLSVDNYPFYVHRNYAYAKGGNFNHFIDSTFSDEGFLSHTYHLLSRNKRGWIDKMVRKKENQGHQSTAIRVEFFKYETEYASTADPNKMRNFTKNQKK
jgi:hypothetical protein